VNFLGEFLKRARLDRVLIFWDFCKESSSPEDTKLPPVNKPAMVPKIIT
jgi:hypothetical protein